jgi:hypothetical protein
LGHGHAPKSKGRQYQRQQQKRNPPTPLSSQTKHSGGTGFPEMVTEVQPVNSNIFPRAKRMAGALECFCNLKAE